MWGDGDDARGAHLSPFRRQGQRGIRDGPWTMGPMGPRGPGPKKKKKLFFRRTMTVTGSLI